MKWVLLSLLSITVSHAKVLDLGDIAVTKINKAENKIQLRNAKSDYEIDLNKLDKSELDELKKSLGPPTKRIPFSIDDKAISKKTDVPLGLRNDCSELPVDYSELLDWSKSGEVKNQADFLAKIPPGTLQTFTLVYSSKSVQSDKVTQDFPRVLRMSQDGKIQMSYVCDPTSKNYGTIEITAFDEKTKSWTYTEVDFRKKKKGKDRIKENDKKCLECHAADGKTNPKPIWGGYPEWPGVYGGHDDSFRKPGRDSARKEVERLRGKNGDITFENNIDEGKAYKKFLDEKVRGENPNPCYASLPWPDMSIDGDREVDNPLYKRRDRGKKVSGLVEDLRGDKVNPEKIKLKNLYQNYPFSYGRKTKDYNLRPGLKFTEVNSHRLAQNLSKRISSQKNYNRLKYLYVIEGLGGCGKTDQELTDMFKKMDPRFEMRNEPITATNRKRFDPRTNSTRSSGRRLRRKRPVSKRLYYATTQNDLNTKDVLHKGDWTLNQFNEDQSKVSPKYSTGIHESDDKENKTLFDGNLPIAALVQGNILKDLAKEDDAFAGLDTTSRGESSMFGKREGEDTNKPDDFACIDDLGGEILLSKDQQKILCYKLLQKQAELEEDPATKAEIAVVQAWCDANLENAQPISKQVKKMASEGIFLSNCRGCHNTEHHFINKSKARGMVAIGHMKARKYLTDAQKANLLKLFKGKNLSDPQKAKLWMEKYGTDPQNAEGALTDTQKTLVEHIEALKPSASTE